MFFIEIRPASITRGIVKLLVVEDERTMAAFVRRGLAEEGFAVDVAADATSADEAVQLNDYDAIVLDVMLPGCDGFSLCRRWRAAGLQTPIIFLTARDEVAERVRGLEEGGDDYLVKPFAFAELLARVRVLLRRGPAPPAAAPLRWGDLVIDTQQRRVWRGGKLIALSVREYQVLEHLAHHAGKVVTRTQLWEHVWESHSIPDSNVVDVYVGYLRNKLGRTPDLIRTVRGGGYVLDVLAHEKDDESPAALLSGKGAIGDSAVGVSTRSAPAVGVVNGKPNHPNPSTPLRTDLSKGLPRQNRQGG
jgi:two-component system OmpR family response regulator